MSFEAKNRRGRWEIHLSEKKEQREIIIIQSEKKPTSEKYKTYTLSVCSEVISLPHLSKEDCHASNKTYISRSIRIYCWQHIILK